MSDLQAFVGAIPGFYKKSAVDQLLILAWYAEARLQRSSVDATSMRSLFSEAGLDAPNTSQYLTRLAERKPPQLLKGGKGGFRLTAALRRSFDTKFGGDATVIAVTKALTELPAKLPDLAERAFLAEALDCYRVKAFRAAIIMVWNLTYDHLVDWVLADAERLKRLNGGITTKYPKKSLIIAAREDLDDLKESELIEAARVAKLLDKNVSQILSEKLRRRNMAAHPSRVTITQHQADDMITDLVANVILKFV